MKRHLEKELQEKTDRLDMQQKRNSLLDKKIVNLQTRLQNKSNFNFMNPAISSISTILKNNGRNNKSGLFNDIISESYTTQNKYMGSNINMSRIGLTPVKKKPSRDSSTFDHLNSNSNNILDQDD